MTRSKSAKPRFSYAIWAKECAFSMLMSDADAGLDVAEETPNPEKAREAVRNLARQLLRQARADAAKRLRRTR